METIYREYSNARWNYWTYAEGLRYPLSPARFALMQRQGCKVVTVK